MTSPALSTNAPIFIVGYIHTGTSLLKTMLRSDPTLFTANGESHFFQDLNFVRSEFPDLDNADTFREYVRYLIKLAYLGARRAKWQRDEFALADFGIGNSQFEAMVTAAHAVDAEKRPQRYAVLFPVVMDQLTRLEGKQRWLEKTPEHAYFLTNLMTVVDDALVVELVRDPRAALASRKHRRTDEWLDAKEASEEVATDRVTNYDPVIDSYLWRESVSSTDDAKRVFPERILTVRYEDMVSEPEQTLRQICDFLGLAFRPEMLDVGWVNATSRTQENAGDSISKAAVDKWRTSLTPEEIFVSQSILRSDMQRYGYEPMPVGVSTWLKSPVVMSQSAANLFNRIRSRRTHGLDHRKGDTLQRMMRRVAGGSGQ